MYAQMPFAVIAPAAVRVGGGERGGALAGLGLTFRYDVVTKTFVPH